MRGADPNVKDNEGKSALDWSAKLQAMVASGAHLGDTVKK